MYSRLAKMVFAWATVKMARSLMRPPTFDFWFWALVVWSFTVPYLWDNAHMRSCDERGTVTFEVWPFGSDSTFECSRSRRPSP